jgi:hypothetical protein
MMQHCYCPLPDGTTIALCKSVDEKARGDAYQTGKIGPQTSQLVSEQGNCDSAQAKRTHSSATLSASNPCRSIDFRH